MTVLHRNHAVESRNKCTLTVPHSLFVHSYTLWIHVYVHVVLKENGHKKGVSLRVSRISAPATRWSPVVAHFGPHGGSWGAARLAPSLPPSRARAMGYRDAPPRGSQAKIAACSKRFEPRLRPFSRHSAAFGPFCWLVFIVSYHAQLVVGMFAYLQAQISSTGGAPLGSMKLMGVEAPPTAIQDDTWQSETLHILTLDATQRTS